MEKCVLMGRLDGILGIAAHGCIWCICISAVRPYTGEYMKDFKGSA